ncbi:reverse transcriptase [Caerostris extrusa]|uniref:Reverse transcriptase n=1 Tax=Caerostris extrusa TaxID=172846 RepID=A0AAV4VBI9_CAEEX|nr:reverse transcriptase [Caerostris extrusa]
MQTLYSDRGSNFLSAAMNEVYEKLGISKQQTLAYNPQGNGLVERLNKTLIDTLSHLVSEKQEDWCQHVPLALMAFRNAHHRTIQETPAFLVYGRDLAYDLIFRDQVRTYSDASSFATQLVNRLQSSFALVKTTSRKIS